MIHDANNHQSYYEIIHKNELILESKE